MVSPGHLCCARDQDGGPEWSTEDMLLHVGVVGVVFTILDKWVCGLAVIESGCQSRAHLRLLLRIFPAVL